MSCVLHGVILWTCDGHNDGRALGVSSAESAEDRARADLLDQYIRDLVWSDDQVEEVLQRFTPSLKTRNDIYRRGPALTECVAIMTPDFHIAPTCTNHTIQGHTWTVAPTASMEVFREFCAEYTEPVAYVALMIIQMQPGHVASKEKLGIHRNCLIRHPLYTQVAPFRYCLPQPPPCAPPRNRSQNMIELMTDATPATASPPGQTGWPGSATPKRQHVAGAHEADQAAVPAAKHVRWSIPCHLRPLVTSLPSLLALPLPKLLPARAPWMPCRLTPLPRPPRRRRERNNESMMCASTL